MVLQLRHPRRDEGAKFMDYYAMQSKPNAFRKRQDTKEKKR
jgi:hypothetical protein